MVDLTPSEPIACELSRSAISSIAKSVATQLGYVPGADLSAIVEKIGGTIEYGISDQDAAYTGSIDIRADDDFTIFLPLDTGLARDRFTIAHELGHWVLHYLYPNQHKGAGITRMRAMRYGGSRAEVEANWFAAAFLMPEEEFRQAYQANQRNLSATAHEFGVSGHAASIRASSLGL